MYTLFYVLAYIALAGFIVMAIMKISEYVKASPLHVRWEIYPIPHEGAKKASYGGSYMEETNWWTKERHVDHLGDLKAMVAEVLFLMATYEHNPKLWIRTYPFHLGLYALMGGTIILIFAVFCQLCGLPLDNGFMIFMGNVINAVSLFGALALIGGGCALIHRRATDKGLKNYTTKEHYLNLGSFVLFGLLTVCAWTFNPSYFDVARQFIYNLCTLSTKPLGSTWFVLNMLMGFIILILIPATNMRHLLIKYFMYHDIRWSDTSSVWSTKNQQILNDELQYKTTWAADHINAADGKTWVDVATTNPTDQKK